MFSNDIINQAIILSKIHDLEFTGIQSGALGFSKKSPSGDDISFKVEPEVIADGGMERCILEALAKIEN